jgi:N utilization substance protein A
MSNNIEIIRVAESVASEKGISVDSVIEAIEQGMQIAAKKKYGNEYDIHVQANRKTGEFKVFKRLRVVNNVEDVYTEISLEQVQKSTGDAHDNVQIDDYVTQPLPAIDIKRLAAQIVKQAIVQKVKVAEKLKQYDLYKDKVGNIVNGIVKKISHRGVLLDIGGVEAFLMREDGISSETFNQNDRIRACIKECRGAGISF